jgi:hypothetical protein
MADFDFDQFEYDSSSSHGETALARLQERARRWMHIGGAVSSVALILGLGLWGYNLAVRDVSGVPVMRALSGAMRIAPVDPGGQQALNQGLTVNAVAAMGSALPASDQITLAPAPASLGSEDLAPAEMGEDEPVLIADAEDGSSSEVALMEPSTTLPEFMTPEPEALDNPAVIRTSLRPKSRPAAYGGGLKLKAVQTVAGTTAAAPAAVKTVEAASIPSGTPLVQFGVFESPEAAKERYATLLASFPEVMAGLTPMIEAAQSGGRNFYRLRVSGYQTLGEARDFCKGLPANATDCIPVVKK